MPEYRAYLIGPDGHFVERFELVCADDEAAKEQAKSLADGHCRALAGGPQDCGIQVEPLMPRPARTRAPSIEDSQTSQPPAIYAAIAFEPCIPTQYLTGPNGSTRSSTTVTA